MSTNVQSHKTEPASVRLGISRNGNNSIWLVTLQRAFLETLPPESRRVSLEFDAGKTVVRFGKRGAKPYGKFGTASVQVYRRNTNLIPASPLASHVSVRLEGSFEPSLMAFVGKTPEFVKEIGVKPSVDEAMDSVDDEPTIQPPEPQTASHARPAEKWEDTKVRDLIIQLRACLAARKDVTINIDNRVVTAKMVVDF